MDKKKFKNCTVTRIRHVVNLKDVLWLKIWLKYKLSAIYLSLKAIDR